MNEHPNVTRERMDRLRERIRLCLGWNGHGNQRGFAEAWKLVEALFSQQREALEFARRDCNEWHRKYQRLDVRTAKELKAMEIKLLRELHAEKVKYARALGLTDETIQIRSDFVAIRQRFAELEKQS